MKKVGIAVLVCLSLGVTACAQNPYGDAYTTSSARKVQNVQYGTVVNLEPVTIDDKTGNVIGTVSGAVLGGIAGSALGGGTGNLLATAGGAILGGAAGNAVGGAIGKSNGVNITIRLDNGRTISVVQAVNKRVLFKKGDRVQVNRQGQSARVSLAN